MQGNDLPFFDTTELPKLTLFGIFIPLSLLDQILSAEFFTNFFGGENLHQLGYFDTLPSSLIETDRKNKNNNCLNGTKI